MYIMYPDRTIAHAVLFYLYEHVSALVYMPGADAMQEEIDLTRLMKLASFGALVHGSTGHFFYNFLDSKIPGTAALTVAKKVFIDQVSPVFMAR